MADFFSTFTNIYYADVGNLHSIAQRAQPFLKLYRWYNHGNRAVSKRFILAGPRGSSGTFGAAVQVANATPSSNHFEWLITPGTYVSQIQIPHKDQEESKDSEDAAAVAIQFELDQGAGDFAQQLVRLLLGQGGAVIGTAQFNVSAVGTAPANALTFTDSAVVANLQVGDQVEITANTEFGNTGSNAALIGSPGQVTEKDDENGWVRVNVAGVTTGGANPGSWVDTTSYNVYRRGEYVQSASADTQVQSKVLSWSEYITLTKATTTIGGVNRSQDAALSGLRLPASSPQINGSLPARLRAIMGTLRARRGVQEAPEYYAVFHPEDWQQYGEQIESQVLREIGMDTSSGYEKYVTRTASGTVNVISEPEQPKGNFLVVDKSQLEMHSSNGKVMGFADLTTGSKIQMLAGAMTYEARAFAYLCNVIGCPGTHARVSTL